MTVFLPHVILGPMLPGEKGRRALGRPLLAIESFVHLILTKVGGFA